jgi:hypothetical protein
MDYMMFLYPLPLFGALMLIFYKMNKKSKGRYHGRMLRAMYANR